MTMKGSDRMKSGERVMWSRSSDALPPVEIRQRGRFVDA